MSQLSDVSLTALTIRALRGAVRPMCAMDITCLLRKQGYNVEDWHRISEILAQVDALGDIVDLKYINYGRCYYVALT